VLAPLGLARREDIGVASGGKSSWPAEHLCGAEPTRHYIDAMHKRAVTWLDIADWEFVASINTNEAYDFAEGIRGLFRRIGNSRAELVDALQKLLPDPDFNEINIDTLLQGG
jgi:hypothetical protein